MILPSCIFVLDETQVFVVWPDLINLLVNSCWARDTSEQRPALFWIESKKGMMTRLERSGVKQVWKNSVATCHESGLLRLTVRYCGILSFPSLDTPTGHVQTCLEICMPRSNTCLESWRSSQSSLALSSLNCSCYALFFLKEKKNKNSPRKRDFIMVADRTM